MARLIESTDGTRRLRLTIEILDSAGHDSIDAFAKRLIEDTCDAVNELDGYVLQARVDDIGLIQTQGPVF